MAQALGAVQDAGVQAVTSDLCLQLAQLATTALYNEDANAARLIAAAFIQGEGRVGWQIVGCPWLSTCVAQPCCAAPTTWCTAPIS